VAKKHGLTGHAASLRWAIHHSALSGEHGDAVVIGASKVEQLKENLEICDAGPLPEEIVETINGVWPSVKEKAPWAYVVLPTSMPSSMFGDTKLEDIGVKI
jgi:aflatoxin B1 aldehyde reductase